MIILGLIFGLLTMVIHVIVITLELIEKVSSILKIVIFIPKEILIRLRIILAMITDYFHPDGKMRAKIISLTTSLSEDDANKFVEKEVDTINNNKATNIISKKEYFIKAIEQLKNQSHPSVKLQFNDIDEVLIILEDLELKQGLSTDSRGNQYISFIFNELIYGIYEIDNEIGLIDFDKGNYEISYNWIKDITNIQDKFTEPMQKFITDTTSSLIKVIDSKERSYEVAYQFILEELDAGQHGTKFVQERISKCGIDANEFNDAMKRSWDDVDGKGSPQEYMIISTAALSQRYPIDLVASLRITIVEYIMEHYGIGKYNNNLPF